MFLQATPDTFWLWQFLGRLHPLIVHFPISLLLVAFLLEVSDWWRKTSKFKALITPLLWIGTLTAALAVGFGWMLAGQEGAEGDTLEIHRWAGIVTLALSILTLLLYRKSQFRAARALMAFTVLGVSVAGHYGALLTHGEDYLTSVLPFNRPEAGQEVPAANVVLAGLGETLNEKQVEDLNLQVRTILAHNCYSCHGEAKKKGDLRLDSKDAIFKGGEGGPVIVPGQSSKSELIRRITLPVGHKEAMPTKGKRLNETEIAVLRTWIDKGAPWPSGKEKSIYRVAELAPRLPEIPAPAAGLSKPVDLFVNQYFSANKISWQEVVDDRIYIRRVYLDVIGLPPSPEETEAFIADKQPAKRELLVKQLLSRDDDYAQHWLTFWNDLLRNDYSGTGYITGGRFDITKWLYNSLLENKPYNRFVAELLNPTKESEGFIRGIKWRGTVNSSQSTEMQAAQNVAQVLMGLNLKCASCHDSFISDWKLEDAYGFANIFADSTLEINRCDKPIGKMASTRLLYPELGALTPDAPRDKRLKELADYFVQPKDGRLYRTLVNRVWAQLMGRGIVEPVDMMDNEPWSQDLLDWLAYDFVETGYNVKQLIFKILTSKTYQLPSVAVDSPDELMAEHFKFRGMVRRRLTAEQFTDAVSKAFTPVYADSSLALKRLPPAAVEKMPFPRASLVINDKFLTALGRPNRETVSTSRTSQANLLQALELTNGKQFYGALQRGAQVWRKRYPQSEELITQLYRNAYGRNPTAGEMEVAGKALGKQPDEAGVQDLLWALTLSPEFQLIF